MLSKFTVMNKINLKYLNLRITMGLLMILSFFLGSCNRVSGDQGLNETEKTTSNPGIIKKSENDADKTKRKFILVFGNSLTAGYGLEESQSFPSLLQERIDSLGLAYSVINAGLSGETTAGGLERIDWVLSQEIDVFILELGANDVLRGLPMEQTEKNLGGIIEKVRSKYAEIPIILAGMQAPPNMGTEYTSAFQEIYPRLAEKYNTGLVPFLLEGVASIPELNLTDGIHPNARGQVIVRDNVWEVLEEYL
jgi:acyl-CoA thioesterase-1